MKKDEVFAKITTAKEKPSFNDVKAKVGTLQRTRAVEAKPKPEPAPVSAGPVDKIVEVLVNPSPDKMLEITDLDRNQVSLIPQLLIQDDVWEYCYKVASFRRDSENYKAVYDEDIPVLGNIMKKFVFLLAQCRRSLGGKTQKALEDLALADLDRQSNEDMNGIGKDFEDER